MGTGVPGLLSGIRRAIGATSPAFSMVINFLQKGYNGVRSHRSALH